MLPSPSLACLTIMCLSLLSAHSKPQTQLQGFSGSEKKNPSTFCVWMGYFLWTLSTLCPEKTDLGKPRTAPSPWLQGPHSGGRGWTVSLGPRPCCTHHTGSSLGHSCQHSPASRPRAACLGPARVRDPLYTGLNSNSPQKGQGFSRLQMASGLPIQQPFTSTPFPGESPAYVLPGSRHSAQKHWTPKPPVLPPPPSCAGQLRSSQSPATSHLRKVTVTTTPRNRAQPGTTLSAPTQTHHQRPGHHVQLHVQLKQVEDEEDDCHQPEEDSDEHHPAVGGVQVVRGVGNQGPHQQPQHLEGRDGARVSQSPQHLGWGPRSRGFWAFAAELPLKPTFLLGSSMDLAPPADHCFLSPGLVPSFPFRSQLRCYLL